MSLRYEYDGEAEFYAVQSWFAAPAHRHCERALQWERAAAQGLVLPSVERRGVPRGLLGRAFREVSNPFAPARALYQTGYLLGALGAAEVTLFAPAE